MPTRGPEERENMTISRRKILGSSLAVPFLGAFGAAAAPGSAGKRFAPAPSGRELMRQKHFPDVPLTTHTGKRVRFYSDLLKDKIVVLTSCTSTAPPHAPPLFRI